MVHSIKRCIMALGNHTKAALALSEHVANIVLVLVARNDFDFL